MKNKILNIGYYIFLCFLGALGLTVAVSAFPITGNIKIMTVLSGSMEPTIRTGSIVIVRPHESYQIGDVITYKGMGTKPVPITHRVAEMRVDRGVPSYVTKGDANNAIDTRLISQKEVIGGVMFSVPYLGYGVATAQKPYGFAALIVIPAMLIIFDQAGKIKKEIVRLRREKEKKAAI